MTDVPETASAHVLDSLFAVIKSRQISGNVEESYTARLFAKGRLKIAQKVGEEAVETVLAAVAQEPSAVAAESADLLYHLLVLWADCNVTPESIWQELQRRVGTSGIAEKNARLAAGKTVVEPSK